MDKTTYTCNGPRRFVRQKRQDLEARIAGLENRLENTDEEAQVPIIRRLAQLRAELTGIADLADDHYLGRAGCGADLTAQIVGIPDDGEVYEYRCTACGNTGTMRRAVPSVG